MKIANASRRRDNVYYVNMQMHIVGIVSSHVNMTGGDGMVSKY